MSEVMYAIQKGTPVLIYQHSRNGLLIGDNDGCGAGDINDWDMINTTKRNTFALSDEVSLYPVIRKQLCDKLICAGIRIFTNDEWYFCCRTTDAYKYFD